MAESTSQQKMTEAFFGCYDFGVQSSRTRRTHYVRSSSYAQSKFCVNKAMCFFFLSYKDVPSKRSWFPIMYTEMRNYACQPVPTNWQLNILRRWCIVCFSDTWGRSNKTVMMARGRFGLSLLFLPCCESLLSHHAKHFPLKLTHLSKLFFPI